MLSKSICFSKNCSQTIEQAQEKPCTHVIEPHTHKKKNKSISMTQFVSLPSPETHKHALVHMHISTYTCTLLEWKLSTSSFFSWLKSQKRVFPDHLCNPETCSIFLIPTLSLLSGKVATLVTYTFPIINVRVQISHDVFCYTCKTVG